jgi:plasmid stabilization system protein ParE
MIYQVHYMPSVTAAIDQQVVYFLEQGVSVERVTAWLADLYDLIDSIEQWPRRCPIDEAISAEVDIEIRRLVFGDYLLYLRVDDDRRCVDVVHFRHAAQETNRLTAEELSD